MTTQHETPNDDIALALGREYLSNILKDRGLSQFSTQIKAQEIQIAALLERVKELEGAQDTTEAPAAGVSPAE